MKALNELCIPRKSIFDQAKRDTVLDLTDLMEEGKINPTNFFTENYLTNGFKNLYESVFKRFEGQSEDGVFRLTQTMGGGKTHSMIALGLMAIFPEFRHQIMEPFFQTTFTKTANVIAFSGEGYGNQNHLLGGGAVIPGSPIGAKYERGTNGTQTLQTEISLDVRALIGIKLEFKMEFQKQ